MLSVFPELLNYSHVAPFILRIALAIILLRIVHLNLKEPGKCPKVCLVIKTISAGLLLAGFLTQAASLLTVFVIIAGVVRLKIKKEPVPEKKLKFLILVIALSLIFLGPGMFSFDLPL
jgi:uncharacterized membrane protein YphA (DoxX/SURF4 family)